jgi:hypothetical protein
MLSKVVALIIVGQGGRGAVKPAQRMASHAVNTSSVVRRNWRARKPDSVVGEEVDMEGYAAVVWPLMI